MLSCQLDVNVLTLQVTQQDDNIEKSDGLLGRLVDLSKRFECEDNYFASTQTEVLPWMRKQLTHWMLEVCEEQSLGYTMFPQAVHILDRYLSGEYHPKTPVTVEISALNLSIF